MVAYFKEIWPIATAMVVICLVVARIVYTQYQIPLEQVIIAEAQQPVFALIYIADANGYFKDVGLDVTYRKFTVGKDALTDTLEGKSDLALAYEAPVVMRASEGHDIGIIGSLHYSTMDTGILARKDLGINSAADLRGKRVGVQKGTNAEYFLESYLANEDVDISDVHIIDVKVEDAEQAYLDRTIDALAIWNLPQYLLNENIRLASNVFYSNAYTEMSVIVGTKSYITSHHDAVSKLLAAIVRAEDYYNSHQIQSIQIVANRLPSKSVSVAEMVLRAITVKLQLDNLLVTILNQEAEWYRNKKVYKNDPPDFRTVIMKDYLFRIRPTSVTIF